MSEITWVAPLKWPEGWPLEKYPVDAGSRFDSKVYGNSPATQGEKLNEALRLLGAKSVVVTSNLQISAAGVPYAQKRYVPNPAVAVYFHLSKKGVQYVMARDAFSAPADNIASLRLAIEGLRQMQRHGGAVMLERAFAGFVALPPGKSHWDVLGLPKSASRDAILSAFREAAKRAHPDNGGSSEAFGELVRARDAALGTGAGG